MQAAMSSQRLDEFGKAWMECDLDKLRDYLAADVIYSPLNGELVRGRDSVLRRFAQVMADDNDLELTFEPAVVSGELGTCRWRLRGQTTDGASFEIDGVDLYEFEGDRIRVKDVYQKAT